MSQQLGFTGGALQAEVNLLIKGESFPATLRKVNQDRSRTRKLNPEDLPKRTFYNMSWKGNMDTILAIKELNWSAYLSVEKGDMNHPWIVTFHHLGGSEILVRSEKT